MGFRYFNIYIYIFKCSPFIPWNKENIVELFKAITESNFDFNKNRVTISEEMKKLLMHLFEKDSEKRFTAYDIVNYPWLNQNYLYYTNN